MAAHRSNVRYLALLSLVLGLLMESTAAASISLTPHSSYKKNFKWSRFKRFFKQTELAFSTDFLQQVESATREELKSQPNPIIAVSYALQEGIDCTALSSDLHKNYIKSDLNIRPEWIHESRRLGECPTKYAIRELPEGYYPPSIMEATCVCEESLCSTEGHHCIPVTHQIPVWIRRGRNYKKTEPVELTVGCVCAKRSS